MMRGEMSKKALSPLIATVLLIAFAVALGTIAINVMFGSGGLDDAQELCSQASISLVQTPSNEGICFDATSKHIKFTVEYLGIGTLPYVVVQATDGRQESFQRYISAQLRRGEQGSFVLAYDSASATDVSARISPVVVVGEEQTICIEHVIEKRGVPLC